VLLDAIRRSAGPQYSADRMDIDGERPSPSPLIACEGPVPAIVDLMREARMSMIANAAQYTFTYRAILEGIAKRASEEQ
jgi:hypothetical protein